MGGLDGLMKHLVGEVALAGPNGTEPADIARHVEQFYSIDHQKAYCTDRWSTDLQRQRVDRRFQEKVWSWLTRQPGVRVGERSQGNRLSLVQLEAYNESCRSRSDERSSPNLTHTSALDDGPLKVHASEDQIWLAVAGHAQDLDKVPRLDFVCLTVIASCRERGILQPDLVRTTGQDKRSVPSRTQRLAERGYIQKLPIFTNSKRTSLLLLSKYGTLHLPTRSDEQLQAPATLPPNTEPGLTTSWGHSKFRPYEALIRQAISILQVENLLMWDDLKKKLEIFRNGRLSKYLAEAVRRFESFKVLQRVRARSQTDAPHALHRCIKLIREPNNTDWELFFDARCFRNSVGPARHEVSSMEQRASVSIVRDDKANYGDVPLPEDTMSTMQPTSSPIPPSWSPDRLVSHVIYNALTQSSSDGLSLQDIRRYTTGIHFSRPLEQIIGRLVYYWQISQPYHLRHLAIIRDAAQAGTASYYVHYTYPAFTDKVRKETVDWTAVQTLREPPAHIQLNASGFPVLHSSQFHGTLNNATLRGSLAIDVRKSGGGNSRRIHHIQKEAPSGYNTTKRKAEDALEGEDEVAPRKPRGRPRKHPKVGALAAGQRSIAEKLNPTRKSQKQAFDAQSLRIRQEVELKIQAGMPHLQAFKSALLEHGMSAKAYFSRNQVNPGWESYMKMLWLSSTKPYVPSIVAHSATLLLESEIDNFPGPSLQKSNTVMRSFPAYLPSSLAHGPSILYGSPEGLVLHTEQASTAPDDSTQSCVLPYFPSIAAHTTKAAGWLWSMTVSGQGSRYHGTEDSNVLFSPTSERRGRHKRLFEILHSSCGTATSVDSVKGKVDSVLPSTAMTYEAQSLLIHRHHNGAFPGPRASLKVFGSKGRPRKCRLVVFKLPSLHTLPWFSWEPQMDLQDKTTSHSDFQQQQACSRPSPGNSLISEARVAEVTNNNHNPQIFNTDAEVLAPTNYQADQSIEKSPSAKSRTKQISKRRRSHTEAALSSVARKRVRFLEHESRISLPCNETSVTPEGELYSGNSAHSVTANPTSIGEIVPLNATLTSVGFQLPSGNEDQLPRGTREAAMTDGDIQTQSIPNSCADAPTPARPFEPNRRTFEASSHLYGPAARQAEAPAKIQRFGGSMAQARKRRFLDVVYEQGGACPGGHELKQRVSRALSLNGARPVPDKKTIQHIQSVLIAEGRLQEIKFTFRDHKGVIQMRTVIALTTLDPCDAKIKDLQRRIQQKHPNPLISPKSSINFTAERHMADHEQANLSKAALLYSNQLPFERELVKSLFSSSRNIERNCVGKPTRVVSKESLGDESSKADSFRHAQSFTSDPSTAHIHMKETASTGSRHPWTSRGDASSNQSVLARRTYENGKESQTGLEENTSRTSKYPFVGPDGRQLSFNADSRSVALPVFAAPKRGFSASEYSRNTFNSMVDNVAAWEQRSLHEPTPFAPNTWVHYAPPRELNDDTEPLLLQRISQGSGLSSNGTTNRSGFPQPLKPVSSTKGKRKAAISYMDESTSKRPRVTKLGRKALSLPGLKTTNRVPSGQASRRRNSGQPRQARSRKPRSSTVFKQEDDRPLLLAVIIVRVLLGGVELGMDWTPVAKMFGHRYDEGLLRTRWSTLRPKHLSSLDRLYSVFRKAFLRAYSDGVIPALDYDNLDAYNWQELLAWSMAQLDRPLKVQTELPATRKAFETECNVEGCGIAGHIDYYEVKHTSTIPQRHTFAHRNPRYLSKENDEKSTRNTDPLDLAKSWVMANVITPDATYKPAFARERLAKLEPETVDQAVSELIAKRFLTQDNKGRATPGRTYHVADRFLSSLKLNLAPLQLAQAVAFKKNLDRRLEAEKAVTFDEAPSDGQMIALMNLASNHLVRLSQAKLPDNKFGLTTQDYRTRGVDRAAFNFNVVVFPTGSYLYGLPLAPLPQIPGASPTGTALGVEELLPVWIDINGQCVYEVWKCALCALLSVLTIASCGKIGDLEEMLESSLKNFEIKLLLEWLVDAGAAKWNLEQESLLQLQPWWWTVLEPDE